MIVIRRLLAALCFILGIIVLAAWGISALVVRVVEDSSLVSGVARHVIEQPAVTDFLVEQASNLVDGQLDDEGVDLEALGLQGAMDDLIESTVSSPQFTDAIAGTVDDARAELADQLTAPESEGEPLTLHLDITGVLNDAIGSTPVLSGLIPDLSSEAVPVEVVDAESFGKLRSGYGWIHRIATWAGWLGLALLALGILATPRKRWLIPLALLWAGIGASALWGLMTVLNPDFVVSHAPGGEDGSLAQAVDQYLPRDSIDAFRGKVMLAAVVLLAAAVASYLIVRVITKRGKAERGKHEENHPAPEHAR